MALPVGEARDGKLSEAVAAFHGILVERPELVRVRLELARTFFLMGEDSLARRHFETVLAGNIPEAVAANVRRFLAALRARKRWHVRFGMGVAPDSNIGASSGGRTVMIDTGFGRLPFTLDEPATEESGVGLALWTGGEYQHPLSQSWRLRAGGDLSRREYRGGEFDRMTLSGHAGPRWLIDARTEASLLLDARRHWSAGKGHHREIGPRLEAQRRLTRRVTAHGGLSRHERRHDRSKHLDGPVTGLHGGLSWVVAPTVRLDLSAGLGRERAKDRRDRNESRWASAGASWALGLGFTVSGALTLRETDYEGGRWPFLAAGERREDETVTYRLSAHNRGLTLWGFSPRVSLVRESRESNAQLHDYERTSGELQFVRLF
ncbi:MAG: surface lipoprotein assembly modifier [Gemmatimonadota bacterium]|nr:surface lipoprotein assembly modifier [Gemmatimonadota bacterium]